MQIHTAQVQKINTILNEIRDELIRAITKHPPMHSAHEAFGVIYEEFNVEFAAELVCNNKSLQRKEMVQVGAMAIRALLDVY